MNNHTEDKTLKIPQVMEVVEWVPYLFPPENDGSYYCKMIGEGGSVRYGSVPYDKEKDDWILGSALLLGIKVVSWMRRTPETIESIHNNAIQSCIDVVRNDTFVQVAGLEEKLISKLQSLKK